MTNKKGIKYIGILVAIAIIATVGFNIFEQQQINNEMNDLLSQNASSVTDGSSLSKSTEKGLVTISGSLVPVASYNVSAQANGKVINIKVKKGELVEEGQLLLQQDDTDVKLATGQGSSSLETVQRLKLAYESAEDTYQKNVALYDAGAISEAVCKQYKNQRDAALLQYQASANVVSEQIAKTSVKSPGAGIVSALNVKEGDYVTNGTGLATVSDISKVVLKGNIEESVVTKISANEKVTVRVDALEKEFDGILTYIGNVAGNSGKMFPVEITIDNKDGEIKAGMSATTNL